MPKKNWTKIGALVGFAAFVVYMLFEINRLEMTDAQKYLGFTVILFLAFFVYFQFLKEYPTPRPKQEKYDV